MNEINEVLPPEAVTPTTPKWPLPGHRFVHARQVGQPGVEAIKLRKDSTGVPKKGEKVLVRDTTPRDSYHCTLTVPPEEIDRWNESDVRKAQLAFKIRDLIEANQLHHHARTNSSSIRCLEEKAQDLVDRLYDLTAPGGEELTGAKQESATPAIEAIQGLALKLCDRLEKLQQKPRRFEALRRIARESTTWPALISERPEQLADLDAQLKALELGRDRPLSPVKPSVFGNDEGSAIAFSLLDYVSTNCPGGMPVFSGESEQQWWEAAEEALLATYPEPELIEELSRLVTGPSKRKSPGRLRQAILDMLERRFKSLAPK